MKIALIGQSLFGAEVYKALKADGHEMVAVFTIPDKNGKPDILAEVASKDAAPVFKYQSWRRKNGNGVMELIPEIFDHYKSLGAELNVLAYVSQFIPIEVVEWPKQKSICYHPSLLPRHRGASSINWTLMCGDTESGFTVFWPDTGLDTGPILLQKHCAVDVNDTVTSLYNRFMFPEGVQGMVQSVRLIATGKAPRIVQDEANATYDKIWTNKDVARIPFDKSLSAKQIHDFIRGSDKVPGAWAVVNGQKISIFASTYVDDDSLDGDGEKVLIEGYDKPAVVSDSGLTIFGTDGKRIVATMLELPSGKTIPARKLLSAAEAKQELKLTPEEQKVEAGLVSVWSRILKSDHVDRATDFFVAGAGSMDVVALVEGVKKVSKQDIKPEDVFLNTEFDDFLRMVVQKMRGESGNAVEYVPVKLHANEMDLSFPNQLFINGKFVDSSDKGTFETINPSTETAICKVAKATVADVESAVKAARLAFEPGAPWREMNARDRGQLMHALADIMEEHKEELATLESLDSGAVYTLALKTHVGMSIDTFRFFAGCCDKMCGRTIPINNARPNKNLCITKKEPVGVCAIIVPWNYPLMMLAWKMAACLAAGNTVILKPAQVTSLTALKFAELSAKAGFPKGVINILAGSGRVVGEALARHPLVRKVGFTGSTEIGKQIMDYAATSNCKRVSLELGGKSPLIIFADCEFEKAVKNAMSAVFFNKGENCIAAGRLFVEQSIHDAFLQRVVEETKKMAIGDPLDRSTQHGPQNHKEHLDKLLSYIDTGVKEGATLVYGGARVSGKTGWFLTPTIFTNVKDRTFMAREESFGPIMIISTFDGNVDSVLRRANDTEFGLASAVFTTDISKALRVSDGLQAGTVYINTYNKTDVASAFGGFKQSGFGKDLGEDALHEWCQIKTITVEY